MYAVVWAPVRRMDVRISEALNMWVYSVNINIDGAKLMVGWTEFGCVRMASGTVRTGIIFSWMVCDMVEKPVKSPR